MMTQESIERLAKQKAAELSEETIKRYIDLNIEIMRKNNKRSKAYRLASEAYQVFDLALGYKFWM